MRINNVKVYVWLVLSVVLFPTSALEILDKESLQQQSQRDAQLSRIRMQGERSHHDNSAHLGSGGMGYISLNSGRGGMRSGGMGYISLNPLPQNDQHLRQLQTSMELISQGRIANARNAILLQSMQR
jgi:hypothetical protein